MEHCLHQYFIDRDEIKSCCDFLPSQLAYTLPVYEVIRIIEGKPLFLSDHLLRLQQSLGLSGLRHQLSEEQLRNALKSLIRINGVDNGNIFLQAGIPIGAQSLHYACWWIPHRYPDASDFINGVPVVLSEIIRPDPNAKVYREDYKKNQQALMLQSGAFETLLYHHMGITEGSKSNVFFILDDHLVTAPDEYVLKGITRQKVIELCARLQLQLEFECLQTADLSNVKAAFLTGTSPKILPIRSIGDDYQLNVQHPWIIQFIRSYNILINDEISNFRWEED